MVDVDSAALADTVRDITGGRGVDVTFECAGHPASVRSCLESLRPRGRHIQVAICGREAPFPIDLVFYKQLTMTGSVCYTAATWTRMFEIFAQRRVALSDLVSHRLPITEWRTAFDLCLNRQALKVFATGAHEELRNVCAAAQ